MSILKPSPDPRIRVMKLMQSRSPGQEPASSITGMKLINAKRLSPDAVKNVQMLYEEYPILRSFIDQNIEGCTSYDDVEELYQETLEHHKRLMSGPPSPEPDWDSGHHMSSSDSEAVHELSIFWDEPLEDLDCVCDLPDILEFNQRFCARLVLFSQFTIALLLFVCLGASVISTDSVHDSWSLYWRLMVMGAASGWMASAGKMYFTKFFDDDLNVVCNIVGYLRPLTSKKQAVKPIELRFQTPPKFNNCPSCEFEGQYLWVPAEESLTCIRCGHDIKFRHITEGVDDGAH